MVEKQIERRRDPRVTFRSSTKLSFAGGRVFDECETTNVSVSGVFVVGITGIDSGEKCDIEFYLTGKSSSLVLEMVGEVVRTEESGVGIQFL